MNNNIPLCFLFLLLYFSNCIQAQKDFLSCEYKWGKNLEISKMKIPFGSIDQYDPYHLFIYFQNEDSIIILLNKDTVSKTILKYILPDSILSTYPDNRVYISFSNEKVKINNRKCIIILCHSGRAFKFKFRKKYRFYSINIPKKNENKIHLLISNSPPTHL